MTKSADGGEQPDGAEVTLESVLSAVNAIASKVETLSEKVRDMDEAPARTLPVAQAPEQLISNLQAGQSLAGRRVIDPQRRKGGFRPDDIVALTDSEKLK